MLGTTLTLWISPAGNTARQPVDGESPAGMRTRSSDRDLQRIPDVEDRADRHNQLVGAERAEGFRNQGAAAAKKGIMQALADAAAIASRQDQLEFYRGLYGVWADVDPVSALDYAQANFQAGQLRSDSVGIAMNKWADENPREAWIWADQHLEGPLKDRALTDLMIGWSRRAPEQAATWLASTGLTSQPMVNALASTWAEAHPDKAAEWAGNLTPGPVKETAQVAVAGEIAKEDPSKAADIFAPEIASGENLNLVISIADIWASTDPAEAAGWVDRMPDGPSKNEAAAVLATIWAASDIHAAVTWSNAITDDETRRQVISHIGTTWGAIEPVAALDWLGTLPAGESTDGVTGALYSWAGTDPEGMKTWIDDSVGDPMVDRARRSLGDVLAQSSTPDAMDLALGMTSAVARDETLVRYFREWRKTDDESAQDWLQVNWSTLPDTAQRQLAAEQGKLVIKR